MHLPGPVDCIKSSALRRCVDSVWLSQSQVRVPNRLSFPRSERSQLTVSAMDTSVVLMVPRHLVRFLKAYQPFPVPAYSILTLTANCKCNIPVTQDFTFSYKQITYTFAGGPSAYLAQSKRGRDHNKFDSVISSFLSCSIYDLWQKSNDLAQEKATFWVAWGCPGEIR